MGRARVTVPVVATIVHRSVNLIETDRFVYHESKRRISRKLDAMQYGLSVRHSVASALF